MVKSFLFGFQPSFILANEKLSKISMRRHFKLHKFDDRLNCHSPLCSCGQCSESTVHFFLHYQLYIDYLDRISEIVFSDVRVYPDQHMCHILLYGSESFNSVANRIF